MRVVASSSLRSVWAEGPSAVRLASGWVVFYDAYQERRSRVMRSSDLLHWEDVTHLLTLPHEGTAARVRHGSIVWLHDRRSLDRCADRLQSVCAQAARAWVCGRERALAAHHALRARHPMRVCKHRSRLTPAFRRSQAAAAAPRARGRRGDGPSCGRAAGSDRRKWSRGPGRGIQSGDARLISE
eukprot:5920343-Prymnesium_polylepis.1